LFSGSFDNGDGGEVERGETEWVYGELVVDADGEILADETDARGEELRNARLRAVWGSEIGDLEVDLERGGEE